ncbi:MAG TPA: efflux RND transporter permease subunit [Gemmataceae bacterium]|nr:efflux RND transporter permease subunit [Gemmataceae bacterium]
MWIVQLALRRPYTFVVMAMLITVLGAVSIYRMPTDIFPEIDIPVVSIVWQFTGMPADEIEERIILVNERVLTTSVNDIERIESQSLLGVGVIRIYFYPGAKIESAVAQVTATSQAILKVMPTGITPPYIVQYSATSVPIIQIAVSSDTLTEQEIFDYASNFIIQRLGTVQGARVPQPWGGKWPQVMVDIDPDELYGRGLSPADVQTAINSQNLIVPSGDAKIGDREYYVRLNSSPEIVAAFNEMPVKSVNGVPVYIKDVAQVHMGYQVQTNVVRRDGRRAVLMTILKGEGASTLEVVRRVREVMPSIQAQMPPELKMEFLFDQSVFVRAAVEGVLREGAIAAGLTALMILLFLGSWRSTVIVATSIPLSILASLVVLEALGQSLNTMTLGGLALAVGILVDDATVELENTHRNFGANKPIQQAILDAASQIATPAFVATLSICIVFVPVVFLSGPAASLFYPLALAVVFAMLTSYLLSRTLVPTMVQYMLPKEVPLYTGDEQAKRDAGPLWRFHERFDAVFDRFRAGYQSLLAWVLDHRILSATALLAFALSSVLLLGPHLGEDFFPSVDAGQFRLHVRAPSGTRVEVTEQVFGAVENVIREIVPREELDLIIDNMGLTPSFTTRAYIDNGTVTNSDGEILVSLKPDHHPTPAYVARLREELPKRFPDCTFNFEAADITSQILDFGLPAPIAVQVVGVKRPENLVVAKKLRDKMKSIPGIVDVHIHQITDYPTLRLDVDRVMASELGLTQQNATGSVLVSLSGTSQVTPNFWVNPVNRVNYVLAVQTPPYKVRTVDDLTNTPIVNGITSTPATSPQGNLAPLLPGGPGTGAPGQQLRGQALQPPPQLLSNLAQMRRTVSDAVISHYNVQPVYEVYADVQGKDLGGVAADVRRVVASLKDDLPRGSTFAIRGQVQSMTSSFRGLALGMLFAVLLVYFLMVVNFQSWLDPFIILTALPGALAGIVWMLFVTQTTVSVPALMGTIMCIGVAMSNSILLITFANDLRQEGYNAVDAAYSAAGIRLRPVLMTALAMTIGMLPMSLGLGEGGEQNAPLGRAVIGGLLLATVFTLVFVPLAYSLLHRERPRSEAVGAQAADIHDPLEPRSGGKDTP